MRLRRILNQLPLSSERILSVRNQATGRNNMEERKKYTLEEAHLKFAKNLHGEVWTFLEMPDRSAVDDERMLYAAYASCYHWLVSGTWANQQRGEWLIARVHSVLNDPAPALSHARRCLQLTQEHSERMEDFDLPFAYESVARASALAGNAEEARQYLTLARQSGEKILDEEEQKIFFDELNGGDWHGIR
jgi:hypothetical protein